MESDVSERAKRNEVLQLGGGNCFHLSPLVDANGVPDREGCLSGQNDFRGERGTNTDMVFLGVLLPGDSRSRVDTHGDLGELGEGNMLIVSVGDGEKLCSGKRLVQNRRMRNEGGLP